MLIPLMLGTRKLIDSAYMPIVARILEDPCALGLIGGRPKHSIYVCGYQHKQLIVLDPHFTQPVVDVGSEQFPIKSWHCPVPKLMRMSRLDPSCAVGFYCRTRGELSDLLDRLPSLFTPDQPSPLCSTLVEVFIGSGPDSCPANINTNS
ncbi:unnamed protein product [Echinostoma caproni]|uniref:Cysteine protease n=1 Tax=Echinostoma caproni TaxID=27848 RepID=A0A3P8H4V8_9TREM|nr:unnamed protein product [Echinostoma caproni]